MKIALFLSLMLALSFSCTRYCPRGSMLPLGCTDLDKQVEEAQVSGSFCQGEWPSECWWTLFNDPSLTALIEAALCCHPDMKIAEARIRLACAVARESRSKLLPHLYGMGDITRQRVSKFGSDIVGELGTFTEPTLLFNAFYEVDIWNKNRALYYADLDATFAAIAERTEAKLLLATAVAQSYFHLQMHMQQYALLNEQLVVKEELLALLKERFTHGVISEFRLYEVDMQVAELADQKEVYEGLIEVDKQALSALAGNSCCELIAFDNLCLHASLGERFVLPTCLPFDLLARRPDVIAKRWLIEAGRYNIHAARARFYPSLDLLAYIGVQSFRLSKLFTHDALMWLGEAVGLLPIFTGGKLQAELSQEEEKYEIAIQEYNKTVLTAVQEVSSAMTNVITQDRRKVQALRSLQDSKSLFDLTLQKYRNGTTNRLALLNAKEDVLAHEELVIAVELLRYESALSLVWAIGGGYDVRRCGESQ